MSNDRDPLRKSGDKKTSPMNNNVVWFLLGGIWLALGHLGSAVLCFVTIIGIPFGIQHLKLAVCALAPVGKTVVSKEVAAEARRRNALARMNVIRGL